MNRFYFFVNYWTIRLHLMFTKEPLYNSIAKNRQAEKNYQIGIRKFCWLSSRSASRLMLFI